MESKILKEQISNPASETDTGRSVIQNHISLVKTVANTTHSHFQSNSKSKQIGVKFFSKNKFWK